MRIIGKTETEHTTIRKAGSMTSALTVLFYIVFSVIKRFGQRDFLFWIPFILFILNLLVQLGMLFSVVFNNYPIKKNSLIWLIIRIVVNLTAAILTGTYLKF
jgi:hypothetical protein